MVTSQAKLRSHSSTPCQQFSSTIAHGLITSCRSFSAIALRIAIFFSSSGLVLGWGAATTGFWLIADLAALADIGRADCSLSASFSCFSRASFFIARSLSRCPLRNSCRCLISSGLSFERLAWIQKTGNRHQ